MLAYVIAVFL